MEKDVRQILGPQIQAVSNAWRILGRWGLVDTIFNHLSVAAPGADGDLYVVMNSYPFLPEESDPETVCVFPLREYATSEAASLGVNPDGLQLHCLMHAARGRPGAIIHTHSVNSIAVGCSEQGLLPISQTAMEFLGETETIEYSGPLRTQPLNDRLRALAKRGGIAFLRNHGSLVVSDGLPEAVYSTYYLEEACRIQVTALSQGVAIKLPEARAIEDTYRILLADRAQSAEQLFEALCRQMKAHSPGARGLESDTLSNSSKANSLSVSS